MSCRTILLLVGALLLTAAEAPPPPPAALAPYIRGDQLEPGDYAWMRGRFAGAGEAERRAFFEVMGWAGRCTAAASEQAARELAAAGYPGISAEQLNLGPVACRQAQFLPQVDPSLGWADFSKAVAEADPVATTLLATIRLAAQVTKPRSAALADQIGARTVTDQMLRFASIEGQGPLADLPRLSPAARAVVRARVGAALVAEDHANTEWLKTIVREGGWPLLSVVGPDASGSAWLLVQHADADPLFQLQALRLMEPLVAKREVSGRNYAYLHDRVMLKLTGRQRYATQFSCRDGKRLPQPLEDEAAVARRRAEAGLEPLAENVARMDTLYGPCPPG